MMSDKAVFVVVRGIGITLYPSAWMRLAAESESKAIIRRLREYRRGA